MKLFLPGLLLISAVTSLLATASTKESRPILQCIGFEVVEDTSKDGCGYALEMQSTDSAILSILTLPLIETHQVCPAEKRKFNVYAKELLEALKHLVPKKAQPAEQIIGFEIDEKTLTVENVSGSSTKIYLNVCDYPVTRNVIPSPSGTDDFSVCVGVEVLEKLVKAMKSMDVQAIHLTFPYGKKANDDYMRTFLADARSEAHPVPKVICTPMKTY